MYEAWLPVQRSWKFAESDPSTNETLKKAVLNGDTPRFPALLAKRQTAGRGRQGRSFFSPEGGIYFSAAYPLTGKEAHLPFFTLLAGLCVFRALSPFAPGALSLKWPNDLMLNGKKACGILAQTVYVNGAPTVILGVGINASLQISALPAELRQIVTSFSAAGFAAPPVRETAAAIVEELDREIYGKAALCGELSAYITELEAHSFLTGRRVCRETPTGAVCGVAAGLSPEGELLIGTDAGETVRVSFGEVLLQ